jgi:hypothetical protein
MLDDADCAKEVRCAATPHLSVCCCCCLTSIPCCHALAPPDHLAWA